MRTSLGSTLIVTQPTSNQSLVVTREYINDARCFGLLAAKCTMPFRMRALGGVIYQSRPPSGIAETPIKGRRMELWGFQETSKESFEERLMAGGYGGYGSTAPERATTPSAPSGVLEWATTLTPGLQGRHQPYRKMDHPMAPPTSARHENVAALRRSVACPHV
jgi:hypothetical protein